MRVKVNFPMRRGPRGGISRPIGRQFCGCGKLFDDIEINYYSGMVTQACTSCSVVYSSPTTYYKKEVPQSLLSIAMKVMQEAREQAVEEMPEIVKVRFSAKVYYTMPYQAEDYILKTIQQSNDMILIGTS